MKETLIFSTNAHPCFALLSHSDIAPGTLKIHKTLPIKEDINGHIRDTTGVIGNINYNLGKIYMSGMDGKTLDIEYSIKKNELAKLTGQLTIKKKSKKSQTLSKFKL